MTAADVALPEIPRAARDGGPRRWSVALPSGLELHAAPTAESTVVGIVSDGAVLSNLGCALQDGRVWCAVRPFRGGTRSFAPADFLRPALGPDGTVAVGPDDSRRRARRGDFDASAEVGCAQEAGEAIGVCAAGVARGGGEDATVVVTFPNGFARTLFFVHGEFVAADATMSGVGTDTEWRVEDGTHILRVDDQRYILPAEFVLGR